MTKKKAESELTREERKMVAILSKDGSCSVKKMMKALDKSAHTVIKMAQTLRDKGHQIVKNENTLYMGAGAVELPPEDVVIESHEIKVGIIADTVLGSKAEQPTNLCRVFQFAEHEGVSFMIHLGVSAGKPTPAKRDEFHQLTFEDQVAYIVANYPRSKIKTRLISGWHDMQWRKDGENILAEVCSRRDDLYYRGDWQADFPIRRGTNGNNHWPVLKAAYNGGDDTPYSKSYPIQGFAENLIQDVRDLFAESRPDIVAVAGQGVFCDLSGGIIPHLISVPGLRLVSQSIMRKKRRSVVPTIGLVILTIKFDEHGGFSVVKSCYPLMGVQDDYHEKFSEDRALTDGLNDDERAILKLLEQSPKSLGELTQAMDRSDETVKKAIAELKEFGYDIREPGDKNNPAKSYKLYKPIKSEFKAPKIDFEKYFAKTVEQAGVSDTHIGHQSELIEIEEDAYDTFVARKIAEVYHTGDVSNGPSKHNEWNNGEVREDRATPLAEDVIVLYPYRKGVKTYMILGDHDRWFRDMSGFDLLKAVCASRPDIEYLGVQQGERCDGRILTRFRHFNWGTGYAKSYKMQQVAEGMLKEIEKEVGRYRGKIPVVLSGGGHVYCAMLYKGMVFIMMPCLQGQTGFITGLGKLSDVGFVIYSITYSDKGVLTRFTIEYFDRGAEALALVRKKKELRDKRLQDAIAKFKK